MTYRSHWTSLSPVYLQGKDQLVPVAEIHLGEERLCPNHRSFRDPLWLYRNTVTEPLTTHPSGLAWSADGRGGPASLSSRSSSRPLSK